MKNNIEKIIHTTLLKNKITDYNKEDFELQLQIHPNYPSFQSITDTLDYFNIDNIAVEVPKEALNQLPENFISLIKNDGYEEIASITKKKDRIEIEGTELKSKKISYADFNEIWEPKIIAVEQTDQNISGASRSYLIPMLICTLALTTVFLLIQRNWDITMVILTLLAILGAILSVFAVRESLGFQSETLHQFCTSVGKSDCNEVINSRTGKLFNEISLADSGILFFGSILLHTILFGFSDSLILPIIAGTPFVLYSLYSQAFIIRKWCAVCLGMAAVFLTMAGFSYSYLPLHINLKTIVTFAMVFSLIAIIYLITKNKLIIAKELKSENIKLSQFKRDEQIFNHLMSLSDTVKDTATFGQEIVLGNPNSGFKIITATNPMCGFCKDAFEAYKRIYNVLYDKVQIIIRLKVNPDDLENHATIVSLILMEIYHKQGAEAFVEAYTKWFDDRTFSNWITNYNDINYKKSQYIEVLHKQARWAEDNQLMYTPATVINGSLYPKKYSYDELFHFVNIMAEDYHERFNQNQVILEA